MATTKQKRARYRKQAKAIVDARTKQLAYVEAARQQIALAARIGARASKLLDKLDQIAMQSEEEGIFSDGVDVADVTPLTAEDLIDLLHAEPTKVDSRAAIAQIVDTVIKGA